jgi:predicted ATP-dependent Lon-type protease
LRLRPFSLGRSASLSAKKGLLKLLFPHRTPHSVQVGEIVPLMKIAVEMRERVTDQLAFILPMEFSNVEYDFQLRIS